MPDVFWGNGQQEPSRPANLARVALRCVGLDNGDSAGYRSYQPRVMAMDTPTIHRPIPGFHPSTPAVTSTSCDAVVAAHPIVVVHFWAVWNGVDPVMDQGIANAKFDAHFVSCDIDDPACLDLCKQCGIATVPTLAVFVGGELRPPIIGLLSSDAITNALDDRVTNARPSRKWWQFW